MTSAVARPQRLAELEPACSRAEAFEFFDILKPVDAASITGRWRGRELATGHPLDGGLVPMGWYGKQFDSMDDVHPLLFQGPNGRIVSVDPRRIPFALADKMPPALLAKTRKSMGAMLRVLPTKKPHARLRNIEFRGAVSAAMSYDHLPIIDYFRKVDQTTLLGWMDMRGLPPYFFILECDG